MGCADRQKEAIHPPVQGGNIFVDSSDIDIGDTPSRTGRKLFRIPLFLPYQRYTLPYREETLSAYAGFSPSKYLVVQIAQITFSHC